MRVILPVFLLFTTYYFLLSSSVASAQYDPIDSPFTSCDFCGRCRDAQGNESKPPDWERCRRCIYNSIAADALPLSGKMWTPIGCISGDVGQAGGFIQKILRFVISISGGLAFLGFLWGGFQLLTASGDPLRLASGKNTIIASGGALLLILFAVFLLQFIGFTILAIPGFGG